MEGKKYSECARRGIVATWQSSLSLSLDTADFSTFRWTANLDNVFTESYEWAVTDTNPRKNFIFFFLFHAGKRERERESWRSILAFRILEDGFSPPLFKQRNEWEDDPRENRSSCENEILLQIL